MNIIRLALSALGALLFRIRGGLVDIIANKIYFPVFIGIVYSYLYSWSINLGLLGFVTAYVAQQIVGWGEYRGALVSGTSPAPECALIDDVLNKSTWLKEHIRVWGFCGCALRGLLSSFLFGLLSHSFIIGISGLLVGLCYLLPTLVLWHTKWHNTKVAWNIGEYLEGALYVYVIYTYTNTLII